MAPNDRTAKGSESNLRKTTQEAMERAGVVKSPEPTARETADLSRRVLSPRTPPKRP